MKRGGVSVFKHKGSEALSGVVVLNTEDRRSKECEKWRMHRVEALEAYSYMGTKKPRRDNRG